MDFQYLEGEDIDVGLDYILYKANIFTDARLSILHGIGGNINGPDMAGSQPWK